MNTGGCWASTVHLTLICFKVKHLCQNFKSWWNIYSKYTHICQIFHIFKHIVHCVLTYNPDPGHWLTIVSYHSHRLKIVSDCCYWHTIVSYHGYRPTMVSNRGHSLTIVVDRGYKGLSRKVNLNIWLFLWFPIVLEPQDSELTFQIFYLPPFAVRICTKNGQINTTKNEEILKQP